MSTAVIYEIKNELSKVFDKQNSESKRELGRGV